MTEETNNTEEAKFVIQLTNNRGDTVFTSGAVTEQTVKDVMNLKRDNVILGSQKMGIQIPRNDGAMSFLSIGVIDHFIISYLLANPEQE